MRARTSARPRLTTSSSTRDEVGLRPDRAGDRRRRLQPLDGALQLGRALDAAPVQVRVLDRDPGPAREHGDGAHVELVELAALLVGEVHVPPRLAADQERDAEERLHRRMTGGEAVRARVHADVGEDQRARVLDQQPEHAAAARQVADLGARRRVDPRGQESLERAALLVEHADRRIARAGQLARRLEQPLQHDLGVQLGHERAARFQQALCLVGVESAVAVVHRAAFNQRRTTDPVGGSRRMERVRMRASIGCDTRRTKEERCPAHPRRPRAARGRCRPARTGPGARPPHERAAGAANRAAARVAGLHPGPGVRAGAAARCGGAARRRRSAAARGARREHARAHGVADAGAARRGRATRRRGRGGGVDAPRARGRVLAGDVAAGVLHGAPCPVVVAPRGVAGDHALAHIAVAYADTGESRAALDAAAVLARRAGAELDVLSAVEPPPWTVAAAAPGCCRGPTSRRSAASTPRRSRRRRWPRCRRSSRAPPRRCPAATPCRSWPKRRSASTCSCAGRAATAPSAACSPAASRAASRTRRAVPLCWSRAPPGAGDPRGGVSAAQGANSAR